LKSIERIYFMIMEPNLADKFNIRAEPTKLISPRIQSNNQG